MPSNNRAARRVAMDESRLVDELRSGDEAAFSRLIDAYTPSLLRVARAYTGTGSVAEEVVQETWLGVIRGLDRFEERCSLKTWIFKILTNMASTRGERERRTVPFSALAAGDGADEGPTVDPDRFLGRSDAFPGHWSLAGAPRQLPEERLLSSETHEVMMAAIEGLPASQRVVITMRDVEGWPPDEVCRALEVSEGNQRVLLHRARAKVRTALEEHLREADGTGRPRNVVPRAATVPQ